MAKKKSKKKVKKAKKKVVRGKKKAPKAKVKAKAKGEKVIAVVDHFFGKISVAAFKLKAPLRVGDMIHIKGHTTDFVQKVDSMQIEHQNVPKAGKGAEIGIKVRDKVRAGDIVYLAASEKGVFAQPAVLSAPSPATTRPEKTGPYGTTRFLKF